VSNQDSERRVYPRFAAPKGTIVAWHRFNKRAVSVVDNLGLGGLFIRTPDPPPAGTFIQLLIDAPTGEVRARATVQRSSPKQGMGRNSSRWNTNIARDSRDGLKLCLQ
jgi:hypothetical protein